jgi:transcriptional regulator with XRE-family HTH domain
MLNISEYLDLVKEKHQIKHEKDLALKIGIKPSSLSAIRSGNGTREQTACKIAELAGVSKSKVLLAATEARCKDPELKKLWHKIAKEYESVAASIIAVATLSPIFDSIQCILC